MVRSDHRCVPQATSRRLAPEDLARGQHVALLSVRHERLPWLISDASEARKYEFETLPDTDEHACDPMKVESVCLPFVLVKQANGDSRVIDVRQCRLALVSDAFARRVFRARGPKPEKAARKTAKRRRARTARKSTGK